MQEIKDHPNGHFINSRCIIDGTTDMQQDSASDRQQSTASENYHILYPGESSDDYGYVDVDGISPLTWDDFPTENYHRMFKDVATSMRPSVPDTIYDSNYRYHPVNYETAYIEDLRDPICDAYLAINSWMRPIANARAVLYPERASWQQWQLQGHELNQLYPKHT